MLSIFATIFFPKKRNRKIRCFSSVAFGLIFVFSLLGMFLEVGICEQPDEQPELRLAAWNVRIMSNKSRTDAELKAIARTLADYDFIAIIELRDEAVLKRTQKILSAMGKSYQYEFSPAVGRGVKERDAFLYKKRPY